MLVMNFFSAKFLLLVYITFCSFLNRDGGKTTYGGTRDKEGIIEFMLKKTAPPSIEVTCAEMDAKVNEKELTLVYFGDLKNDKFELFMSAANSPRLNGRFWFYHTRDPSCAEKYGTSAPGIALNRHFEESPLKVEETKLDDLIKFALSKWFPKIVQLSDKTGGALYGFHANVILFIED
jgi:hypothetical protein